MIRRTRLIGVCRLGAITLALAHCALTAPSLTDAALTESRSYSGVGNNLEQPFWGAANQALLRKSPATYPDSIGQTIRTDPNPREISNRLAQELEPRFDERGLSGFAWQWGQFLDHDISLTVSDATSGGATINVPDSTDLLHPMISMHRSQYLDGTGITGIAREQTNQISSYIDASNVYGSDHDTSAKLRSFTDGLLLTSRFELMPHDDQGSFLGGDVRANEQLGLMSMHTLFVREHNRLAQQISANATDLPSTAVDRDEEIFQRARKLVGAEMQAITYNEFLPAILGNQMPNMLNAKYDPSVDASVANEFAHGLYRFGHSMLPANLKLMDDTGALMEDVPLREAFFKPSMMSDVPSRLAWILKGLANQPASRVDLQVTEDVRSFLMLEDVPGGLDLAAINIQRGRDHGLPDYNSARLAYGLDAVTDFAQITSDIGIQTELASLYVDVDQIDLFVGALAEDHLSGASVGPLIGAALIDQFVRLRDGDRMFYQFDPDLSVLQSEANLNLSQWTLADVIRFNTDVQLLQNHVFFVPEPAAWLAGWLGIAAFFVAGRRTANQLSGSKT